MIDFVTVYDFDEDFWLQNPELKYMEPFASFYKTDNSSLIMKAIYLAYDFKSKFNRAGISIEESKKDIAENYIKDSKFEWGKYNDIISSYQERCKTKVQKALEIFEADVIGFQNYLSSLSWEDQDEALVKASTYKVVEDYYVKYKNCESLVKEEINEKKYRNDYRLSPSEKLTKPDKSE